MPKSLPKIDTTQLAMMLTLAGAVVAISSASFTANGNVSSAVYEALFEGSTAIWHSSNLIEKIVDPETGCGVQKLNTSLVSNVTNASSFFHKKFLHDKVSLFASSPANPFIKHCMEELAAQFTHTIKQQHQEAPMPAGAKAFVAFFAVCVLVALVGLSVAVARFISVDMRDQILQPFKQLRDGVSARLALSQENDVDPEARPFNDSEAPTYSSSPRP